MTTQASLSGKGAAPSPASARISSGRPLWSFAMTVFAFGLGVSPRATRSAQALYVAMFFVPASAKT